MARHTPAFPYSRQASDCSESPATTRCTRRAVSAPEVGFCPAVLVGISLRLSLQRARIGTPVLLNRV